MKEATQILEQFVPLKELHPQVQLYLEQLVTGKTSRRNLTQIRVNRNAKGLTVDAWYAGLALQLHTLITDYKERTVEL